MKNVFALTLAASGLIAGGLAQAGSVPTGALVLGYDRQVFFDAPNMSEVSPTDTNSGSRWYPGSIGHNTEQNLATRELLGNVNGELAIKMGGSVVAEAPAGRVDAIPLLSGAEGFYIEFAMRMSSNDPDHFAGLYLETAEHNPRKQDHFSSDPAGYERWNELDVCETGYGPGALNTLLEWWGNYPLYSHKIMNNSGHEEPINFMVEHRYGMSYDPATNVVQWYIDDKPVSRAVPTNSVTKAWHYYAVMEASSHGAYHPYEMYIHYVRAFAK